MIEQRNTLGPFVRVLKRRFVLDAADADAVLTLPHTLKLVDAGRYIIREGDLPSHCIILLKGVASRHKTMGDGTRQVVGLHMEGEPIDLHYAMLFPSVDNVQALTPVEVALVPHRAMLDLMHSRPAVADAIWTDSLAGSSVFREWIANVGRRGAYTRLAHLICEMALRQGADISSGACSFYLPLTQTDMADALGLTSVHVNRTLQALRREGLVETKARWVKIPDWTALADAGDFCARYLQLSREHA